MTVSTLLAADLDRTLIYSRAGLALAGSTGGALVAVESYQGNESSFMTAAAATALRAAVATGELVPVTTRTPEQLHRVHLPTGATRYSIAANGGVLLVDGAADPAWHALVTARLTEAAPLSEVHAHLMASCGAAWAYSVREAAGMFCYAVVERARVPVDFVAGISAWASGRGWTTSLQGRKLYLVPVPLTKSAAVAEVVRRTGARTVLAAGDSLLDIDLLEAADAGIHPAHGEIADSGWTAPHVVRTRAVGGAAGEEICRWFSHRATNGALAASDQR